MPINPASYLEKIKANFEEKGNPEVAEKQMKYMRNQFAYYGLKAPVWLPITKKLLKEEGIPLGDDLKTLARLCYEDEYREVNYFGIEMVQKVLKKQEEDFLNLLEEQILEKSWWDTVDWIAKLVGIHFLRYPHLIKPTTEKWMATNNFWLQRTSIIFQLFYREKTDTDLLFKYIKQIAHSKEFFLQKAAGWALRQHSRTDAEIVIDFIDKNTLAPLTKREGLRLLKKKGIIE